MDDSAPTRHTGSRKLAAAFSRQPFWLAHATLVLLVGGYIGLSAAQHANIGLGLGLFAMAALGAPWTAPLFMVERLVVDSAVFVMGAIGGAVLNLVLHAMVVGWPSASRAARRGGMQHDSAQRRPRDELRP